MRNQLSSSSAAESPAGRIQPGSGVLLLLEAMADCNERIPHEDIYRKLEKVLLDTVETGDLLTGRSLSLDPTPEMIAAIQQALAPWTGKEAVQ